MGQIVHIKYVSESVKDTTKLKEQSQKNLLTFLKALWIVIPTINFFFECKKSQFKSLYEGSTATKFRFRFSNYKSTHRLERN